MIRRLAPYMRAYKKYAILAPLLIVLEVFCELALPKLMANIVNDGILTGNVTVVWQTGLQMLLLACLAMALGVGSAKCASVAGQGFGATLRQALFHQVQEFSFGDIDRFSSASLITRMTNDVYNIQMLVTMGLRMLARAPVMMLTALVIALSINAKLAAVLVVVIPVMAVAMMLLMRVCNRLFEIMQQRIDALNAAVQENLIAIRVVKAFVRAGYEKTKFCRANDALTQAALKAVMRIILMQPLMLICFNAATLGVLWVGGRQVIGGTLLIGDLSSFLSYIFQILISVMLVAMALLQLSRAEACARRIIEVLDAQPEIRDGALSEAELPAPRGEVEFRNVSFRYAAGGTGANVLEKLSFTIAPGQFVAIVGGTGVGKSSLVNLIPRFYDVAEGQVLVDGVDVRDYPLDALRRRVGMVLQKNVLFSGTIRENLLWGDPNATEEEMFAAARNAQAYDFVMDLPDGFDTWLDQGGTNVSGGQKQRLCIARAMLRHPAILILDDSTSAVDSQTEAAIRQSFQTNLKDTTVLLIAQRISSVEHADCILLLDDGHLADMGTHKELLARSPIYQEIYFSQQKGGAA